MQSAITHNNGYSKPGLAPIFPQHAWNDDSIGGLNYFYAMSTVQSQAGKYYGEKIYKYQKSEFRNQLDYLHGHDLNILHVEATAFLPVNEDMFLLGTNAGFIKFVAATGFDHRMTTIASSEHASGGIAITKIFAVSMYTEPKKFVAQDDAGRLFYFELIRDSEILVTRPVNISWLYPEAQVPSAMITEVLASQDAAHIVCAENKLVLINDTDLPRYKSLITLSARVIALDWWNGKVFCVLEDGRIEVVKTRNVDNRDVFDEDAERQIIQHNYSRNVVAACFLNGEGFIILLQHEVGRNAVNIVAIGYDGDFVCEFAVFFHSPNSEIYDPKVTPAYENNEFIVSFRQHEALGQIITEFHKFTINSEIAGRDAGGGAGGGGGGRGEKRPPPDDDAPQHVKKAYYLNVLKGISKEAREALLNMSKEMREMLIKEQCNICMRDYNRTIVKDKDGRVLEEDTSEITPVVGECGHHMCEECEDNLVEKPEGGKECPSCRQPWRKAQIEMLLLI